MPAYPPGGQDRHTDAPHAPTPAWPWPQDLTPPAGRPPGAPSSGLPFVPGPQNLSLARLLRSLLGAPAGLQTAP